MFTGIAAAHLMVSMIQQKEEQAFEQTMRELPPEMAEQMRAERKAQKEKSQREATEERRHREMVEAIRYAGRPWYL